MADQETVEQLLAECASYDFIRFTWHDITGRSLVKAVPARHLRQMLKEGIKVWEGTILIGSSGIITHNLPSGMGTANVSIMPQPGTLYPLPWVTKGKHKVAAILCEPCLIDTLTPQKAAPRYLAKHQLSRLSDRGMKMYSGFELEFMMFDNATKKKPIVPGCNAFVLADYHAQFEDFMYTADTEMQKAGIDAATYQMEYGASQLELAFAPAFGIASVDQLTKCKQALREIARQHDMFPVFMSKPSSDLGNGLHFSFSVCQADTGKNVFYDSTKPDNLSNFARYWLAGLVSHARALTALYSPTVNCPRRYHTSWSPDSTNWNFDDRDSSFRMKNYDEKSTYIENRLPGGSANPYVVMAATIAAGLDGVEKEMKCPQPGSTETGIKLPHSFAEAFTCLKEDEVLRKALGEEFIAFFSAQKEAELEKFEGWSYEDQSPEAFEKEKDFYLLDV